MLAQKLEFLAALWEAGAQGLESGAAGSEHDRGYREGAADKLRQTARELREVLAEVPALPTTEGVRVSLGQFAKAAVFGMAKAYRIAPEYLLQTIAESYLDAAGQDGALQLELASAAFSLKCTGRVPGCWLEREDHDTSDSEPSSGGSEEDSADNRLVWDAQRDARQSNVRPHPEGWVEMTEGQPGTLVEFNRADHLSRRERERQTPSVFRLLKVPPGDYSRPVATTLNGHHCHAAGPAKMFSLSAAEPEPVTDAEIEAARLARQPAPVRALLAEMAAHWRTQAEEARKAAQDLTPFNASHKLHGQADLLEQCADTLLAAIDSQNGEG